MRRCYTCEFTPSADSWAVEDEDPGYDREKGSLLGCELSGAGMNRLDKDTDHASKEARGTLKRHAAEHGGRYEGEYAS